ncbi:Biphenyl-2,3-diol 1,2-dioxygenase [Pigmentiphaga humi]|uniref:Biphenyl-2,3-diol 1,2-dioxygenase n=1 Tax=Pigmentiphaga humi TaxID=2478468 RepID=A0A3P4B5U6_9BURK|nr:VOC family protein [Pigmentiphaga humi]VCU71038.1 Biphenyl-2,3-diol 1,2-dioxygenase [Pigmentiphaga humi]
MQADLFDVGGVQFPRPFRIRRLGHFGINVLDPAAAVDFYCRLLGFRISDQIDFGARLPQETRDRYGPGNGYFLRHGTEHHSFVLFPRRVVDVLNPHYRSCPDNPTNQITWQVGSLREVVQGFDWFKATGRKVLRAGRDVPGSNWHFYPPDPDGHVNELFYGIEQVGWSGRSKPVQVHQLRHDRPPSLPHRSEYAEINEALAAGMPLDAGVRAEECGPEIHDVDGVLLARPFKVVRIGPVRLFVKDLAQAVAFYRDTLGLQVTEEVVYAGHRCVFLRANTEHHSIALYPAGLRAELGLADGSSLMSFGLQLGSYAQLKRSLEFLAAEGVAIRSLPGELFPGIDYQAFAVDPDGHLIQLYYRMDQIGWDGRPRPRGGAAPEPARWPEVVPASSDVYQGEVFLGPLN